MWKGNTSPGFPPAIRDLILNRDPRCRCPGCPHHTEPCTRASVEADHITPWSAGGSHTPDNGRGLCTACHKWWTQQHAMQSRGAGPTRKRPPEAHPGAIK